MVTHAPRPSLLLLSCLCLAALAPACARTVDCASLGQCGINETGDESGTDGGDGLGDPIEVNRDVDILFVIDNSGSMGEEQAILAANVATFINVLEADDVEADYRIGVTTTDMGNIWCPSTTPEAGRLVMSSCKTRLADFLFSDTVDVQDLACNDICTLDESELEILPTTTDVDPTPKPRPWLERIAGQKNIPSTTSTAAAFACFGPQGVNGCGFESPLEAMYFAVVRAGSSMEEENFGFIRDNAILAVIFLTDEVDCSLDPDWAEIFEADGNKAFWSDPSDSFPTSAVCWNAGVQCQGDPSSYDSCDPINKGATGALGVSDDEAVLYPVSRYVNRLQEVENSKQALNPEQEVIVALIAGVTDFGEPIYADSDDPQFQHAFGIGPGCEAPNPLDPNAPIQALPPVRLRELTNAFTPGNMFSICAPDYSPALEEVASRIRVQLQPACFSYCVADSDPATELVDAACTLNEVPGGPVPECTRDADGYVLDPETNDYMMPGPDVNVCYALRTDKAALTADLLDDMASECIDASYNLEFAIERRPGFPAASGVTLTADCELAPSPELTCPGIGG